MELENLICGSLRIFLGPMFAGKSSICNAELIKQNELGAKVLKIIHEADRQRRGTKRNDIRQGTTHNEGFGSLPASITIISVSELKDVDVTDFQVIGIDEGQFFPDLLDTVPSWVDRLGKHVIVSGLDGDTSKNAFGQMLPLITHADEVVKLNAICKRCIEEQKRLALHYNANNYRAPFTKRLIQNADQVVIGGAESFEAVCRYHYLKDSRGSETAALLK